jgi:hypothetical protein
MPWLLPMRTPSSRLPAAAALAAGLLAGLVIPLGASTPAFWTVASQADFLKGDTENLSIDSDGRVTLGPANEVVADVNAPFVWEILGDADGRLFLGTGSDGKVLRIDPDGSVATVFDASELDVHALAFGPAGRLYVGTSPDGKVYRIERDGSVYDVFDPPDKYIWAMAVAPDGTLYVATGEKGAIYRVGADGQGTVVYRSRATNVTALAIDRNGDLLVGTEAPGQLLRVTPGGRAFVLLDSALRELRAIRVDARGTIYAAAVSGRAPEARPAEPAPAEPARAAPVASVSTEITITAIGEVPTQAGPATPPPRPDTRRDSSRGAIFRIQPDGLWDTLWETGDDLPYDLGLDGGGALLVATGNKGKIVRVEGDPVRTTLVARAAAQQVTMFARDRQGRLFYATANPGKVFRLTDGTVTRGVYESEIRDTSTVAAWGTIRWHAETPPGTSVEIFTRSGNTRTPDDTWSDWSPAYTNAEGQPIASPNARYLQWRAVLARKGAGPGPVLTSVTVAYLPRNTRPSVASITVHPPGVVFARPFPTGEPEIAGFDSGTADARPAGPGGAGSAPSTAAGGPPLGRRLYQKSLQTFVWKADDEPGDRLIYDVYYRRQGQTAWTLLRRGLWDPILTWDTTTVPDGTYTIKVVASDSPTNAPEVALSGERESDPFDVDNTPPAITVTGVRQAGGQTVVEFTVRDTHSPLDRVEYAVDATRWRLVYPADGIADSKVERYQVTLEPGVALPVTLRATDALGNIGTAVVEQR